MRLNKFLAQFTELSRRAADQAIEDGRVTVNGQEAALTTPVNEADEVTLDGQTITANSNKQIIILNKPVGYVVSRDGQGSQTIYDILPKEYSRLNPVGRLDKDSSGLLVLTNDGDLANRLTHPSYQKIKIYNIELDKLLEPLHQQIINDHGIQLDDGLSKLTLETQDKSRQKWQVTMHEGRNRQIRRTFEALGYKITRLHRIQFGDYTLKDLPSGEIKITESD